MNERRTEGADLGRVVHTIPTITPSAGGPTYSVPRVCQELIATGLDLSLLVLREEENQTGLDFVKSFEYGWGPWRLGRSPDMYKWLAREAKMGKVSLIHTHSLWMMPNVYSGWAAGRHGTPLVVAPRGTLTEYSMASGSWVKKVFWPLVQRPALVPTTCFQATSEAEYRDIRRLGFRQPVAIIPNGIDEMPTIRIETNATRTILYLGRIHPEKGVDRLLRAWARVESLAADWRLRIVGSGEAAYVEEMRLLARNLGLTRCEFSGPLYGHEKLRAYQECDVYALPSVSENFGVAIAEALMAGRPVICTKGTPWEGLHNRDAGWWIDVDVESLSAALRTVVGVSRERLAAMGANGREWMREEFSWRHIGLNVRRLYQWILFGGSMPNFVVAE